MDYEIELDHAQPCDCEKCGAWYKQRQLMRTIMANRLLDEHRLYKVVPNHQTSRRD